MSHLFDKFFTLFEQVNKNIHPHWVTKRETSDWSLDFQVSFGHLFGQTSQGKSSNQSQISLFVTSCGLIVDGKCIGCPFLVKLYTSHQINLVREIFVNSYLSITFCDGCFHVDKIRI